MADTAEAVPALNLVAIDIARYWNYVLVETAVGRHHRFRMANTAADFDRLIGFLASLGCIALATTDEQNVSDVYIEPFRKRGAF